MDNAATVPNDDDRSSGAGRLAALLADLERDYEVYPAPTFPPTCRPELDEMDSLKLEADGQHPAPTRDLTRQPELDEFESLQLGIDGQSAYSSSVYSETSSAYVEDNTMSSIADHCLSPRPLDLSRKTSEKQASSQNSSDVENSSVGALRPKHYQHSMQDSTSLSDDDGGAALDKEIAMYPMVESSAIFKRNGKSPSSLYNRNKKAAKVLGLDGAGSSPVTPQTPSFKDGHKESTNKDLPASPRSLKAKFSNITLRKKSSLPSQPNQTAKLKSVGETETDQEAFTPNMPYRATEHKLERGADITSLTTSTTSASISKRRGLLPVSIRTSVFDPFGTQEEMDDPKTEQTATKVGNSAESAAGQEVDEQPKESAQPLPDNFVLKIGSTSVITNHARADQHPMFHNKPFEVKSGCSAPLPPTEKIATVSRSPYITVPISAAQLLEQALRPSTSSSVPTAVARLSLEKSSSGSVIRGREPPKELKFDTNLKPSGDTEGGMLDAILGLPTPRANPVADDETVLMRQPSHTTPFAPTVDEEVDITKLSIEQRCAAIRAAVNAATQKENKVQGTGKSFWDDLGPRRSKNFSGLFRPNERGRPDRKISSKDLGTSRSQALNPARGTEQQITILRNQYDAASAEYSPTSQYPRHPNTSRSWVSKNLKCTTCLNNACPICGAFCCVYREAQVKSYDEQYPQAKELGAERVSKVDRLLPQGKETPTFIQCTHGGGCGRLVCPSCIGQCPLFFCMDTQCKECKPDPWAVCDFHGEEEVKLGTLAE